MTKFDTNQVKLKKDGKSFLMLFKPYRSSTG